MYRLTITMEPVAECRTFGEAVSVFMAKVRETLDRGSSHQELETMHWVECREGERPFAVLDVYDMVQLAHDAGFMKEGKVVNPLPDLEEAAACGEIRKYWNMKQVAERRALLSLVAAASHELESVKTQFGDTPELADTVSQIETSLAKTRAALEAKTAP